MRQKYQSDKAKIKSDIAKISYKGSIVGKK